MAATNDHDISVLNDLISVTLDSARGYEESADDAKNPTFKAMFVKRAGERRRIAGDLQARVRSLGGNPEDDGSTLAAAHRVFVNLKSALGTSDQATVEEVERGEDHIKDKYEDAMQDGELSASVREAVRMHFASIKADHDSVSEMKHRMKAAE
ncbi:MAG: PA2169 family four-helix-bundle protein [Dongiaceae bacterium]